MRKLTQNDKRRIREANRKAADLDAKHQNELTLARDAARHEGRMHGRSQGAKEMRDQVLEHAGRLYKEGKDTDAAAVRDVHRQLPASV